MAQRPDDCAFDILTSTESKSFEEVGMLEHYNGEEPKTLDEFRKAVATKVCRVGGDAVVAIANDKGLYTKGTIIHYVPDPGPPIASPAKPQPEPAPTK